jgi:hypothetical protein
MCERPNCRCCAIARRLLAQKTELMRRLEERLKKATEAGPRRPDLRRAS